MEKFEPSERRAILEQNRVLLLLTCICCLLSEGGALHRPAAPKMLTLTVS